MGVNGDRLIRRIIDAAPSERRKLHVPEWGTDLYFEPLTRAQLEAAMPKEGDYPSGTQSLFLLVHMAKDADGKRVFEVRDIDALREKADLNVLTRVESFMWGTQLPSVAEAKAELKNVPSSSSDSK